MFRLGLLNCSAKKLPVPAPAWLLYSRSPRFSQQFQSLTKRCERVLILSGKYGAIEPAKSLTPYDQKLVITRGWLMRTAGQINALEPESILSYLSGDYRQVLPLVRFPVTEVLGCTFKKSQAIGPQGKLQKGDWTVCWPMEWLLVLVASRPTGIDLGEVEQAICERYDHPGTRRCQIDRVIKCPLHVVEGDLVRNKYV